MREDSSVPSELQSHGFCLLERFKKSAMEQQLRTFEPSTSRGSVKALHKSVAPIPKLIPIADSLITSVPRSVARRGLSKAFRSSIVPEITRPRK